MPATGDSTQNEKRANRFDRRFAFYLLACFLLGATLSYFEYLGKQPVIQLRATAAALADWYCFYLPNRLEISLCPRRQQQRRELKRNIASLPDLNSAMARMRWHGGNEALATRYTVLVRSLQAAGFKQPGHAEYWAIARKALTPIREQYPEIVAASHCYWCNYHDSNLFEWFTTSNLHPGQLLAIAQTTPHLFGQFENRLRLDEAEKLRLAQLQARLAHHGNRGDFLSRVLRRNGDFEHFSHLVRNTISAAPLLDADWSSVPIADARLSWQQGVRHNDDLPQFTEYLLAQGYRPALRWLLWLLAEANGATELSKYRPHFDAYSKLYRKYVDFDLGEGQDPAAFYSLNWQAIGWQQSSRQWTLASNSLAADAEPRPDQAGP